MIDKKAELNPRSIVIMAICLFLGLNACQGVRVTPFMPPTAAAIPDSVGLPIKPALPSILPTQNPATDIPRPTATPSCIPNLTYLEDMSIPDGMQVSPGEQLDKRWRVQNSGTCNWDINYRLKLIAGPDLSAPIEQTLYPARSGTEATIRIIFIAPQEPGTYRSAWEAYAPEGRVFGDPIFIEVVVQ